MNRVTLVGRLAVQPELRYTQAGVPFASFRLAVRRTGNGEPDADFIPVVCWRKLAEAVARYGTKGRLVAVDGRLQVRSYDDSEGIRRTAAEVVAGSVTFLDRRREVAAEDPDEAEPAGNVS